ncbi:MAG: DNA-binding response regulator [Desulfobulbaceae bacterium S3730MH12]|nr:MAG: DNA-binding response regulator [Desulfobulbaceae bacterium S3730MH12]
MPGDDTFRIVLADDHSLIRHGIKNLIKKHGQLQVVGEVSDGEELLDFLKIEPVDMVILDISMRKINGVEVAGRVKKKYPGIKILMLTMHDSQQVFYNAMVAGADGYLLKDDSGEELLIAIEKVQNGKKYISPTLTDDITDDVFRMHRDGKKSLYQELSKREKQVLQLVVDGNTSKEMAEHLGLSPRTIDHHRSRLLKKLNKKNSVDLVNFAVRSGLINSS